MSKNSLKLWNCNPRNNNSDTDGSWTCVENNNSKKEHFENIDPLDMPMFNSINKFKTQLCGTGKNADFYFYGSIILIILLLFLLSK